MNINSNFYDDKMFIQCTDVYLLTYEVHCHKKYVSSICSFSSYSTKPANIYRMLSICQVMKIKANISFLFLYTFNPDIKGYDLAFRSMLYLRLSRTKLAQLCVLNKVSYLKGINQSSLQSKQYSFLQKQTNSSTCTNLEDLYVVH